MSSTPDTEQYWAVLSGECVAALGLMGWPKPATPTTDKTKKLKGKKK
jgi:hypothetical protein